MNKAERASYLVSLHTILEIHERTGVNLRSHILTDEYEQNFNQLKKEILDDAGKSESQQHRRNEAATSVSRC